MFLRTGPFFYMGVCRTINLTSQPTTRTIESLEIFEIKSDAGFLILRAFIFYSTLYYPVKSTETYWQCQAALFFSVRYLGIEKRPSREEVTGLRRSTFN